MIPGCLQDSEGVCRVNKDYPIIETGCVVDTVCRNRKVRIPLVDPSTATEIRISGPISLSTFVYSGVKYYLFGDAHHSYDRSCEECTDYNLSDLTVNHRSKTCYDITVLLHRIFRTAELRGEHVDFFLETAFRPPHHQPFSYRRHKKTLRELEKVGFISKIRYVFDDCFNRRECKYSTTRFHHADIRRYSEYHPESKVEKNVFVTIDSVIINYYLEYILMMFIERKPVSSFSRFMSLLKYVYSNNLPEQIFRLVLTSDDYLGDVSKLLGPLLVKYPWAIYSMLDPMIQKNLVTEVQSTSGSLNQHRIRKQLYKLEQEGQKELAGQIAVFALKEYQSFRSSDNMTWIINELDRMNVEGYTIKHAKKLKELILDARSCPSCVYVDAYFLGRLCRRFAPLSTTKIVYIGNYHAQVCRRFFNTISKVTDIRSYGYDYDPLKLPTSRCIIVPRDEFELSESS